jgi:shikimate kinase
MGTGKSALGRALAARLERRFLDTDALIEAAAGRSIPRIFAEAGEAAFRSFETRAIADAAAQRDVVIATGGGALGRPENLASLRATGVLVCLTADPHVILARTAPWSNRPLLAGAADPTARVTELLAARTAQYAQADFTVDTSHLTIAEAAAEVIRLTGVACRKG